MNGLDLFSGIGGLSLALSPWCRTIAYCEQDHYAQSVLLSRMSDGSLDRAPIFTDVRELKKEHFLTRPDIISGGFPCQDLSVAGNRKGLDGDRSGLFWEIHRLSSELKPKFIFLENVPGIRTKGLDRVVRSLSEIGYDSRWCVVSAKDVGAPHLRKRWFMLAKLSDSNSINSRNQWEKEVPRDWEMDQSKTLSSHDGKTQSLAHTNSGRCTQCDEEIRTVQVSHQGCSEVFSRDWWAIEPNVGRVANGIQRRVDRIRCLGNAVVPLQAQEAFKILSGLKYK